MVYCDGDQPKRQCGLLRISVPSGSYLGHIMGFDGKKYEDCGVQRIRYCITLFYVMSSLGCGSGKCGVFHIYLCQPVSFYEYSQWESFFS